MDKIRTRNGQDKKDQWDLERIYENIDSFDADFKKAQIELQKLIDLEKDFLKTAQNFKDYFMQDETTFRIIEKLSVYANCKSDEDKANSIYQDLVGKVVNLYTEYEEKTAAIIPRILKTDKKVIDSYIKEYQELTPYKYYFEVLFSKAKHTLDEEVEKIISAYQPVLSSSYETSSYLMNADIEFGTIIDEEDREVELTEANYSNYIQSDDRRVRKDAFMRLYQTYAKVKNTLTSTYSSTVNYDAITSRLRNYNSSIEMYLKPKNIPVKLYDNLIKTVRDNLPLLYEYYDLKKKILNLDEFHLYDTYVRVIKDDSKKEYSFTEAQQLVVDALSILGSEYVDTLKTAFSDRWIDKYPNKGKKSGAYSTGTFDTLPYVLLNYTNTYNDVSTLAHELGHSMHTYYSTKNNPYITANYPIFLAEIASTTNELLLNHYMYEHSTDRCEKLKILNEKLDLFKGTIFRQTMFSEFERIVHEYVDAKNVLTSDYLCELYYNLNTDYFGDKVVVDDEIRYEWLRIPHFYSPFYVYQYATSLSISCYIAENIINNTTGFKEKYIEFLSSGGRDYPLEVLKIIDIDLNNSKVFESAISAFKNTLDEFRKVYYEK